jgi:hypothetical protein
VALVVGRRPPWDGLDRAGDAGQHDLLDRQVRPQRVPRIDEADVAAQLAHVDPAELVPEDVHRAAGRVVHRAAEVEQGRLAGTVGSDQRPVLAPTDRQVDVGEQVPVVTDDVDPAHVQDHVVAHATRVGGRARTVRGRRRDAFRGRTTLVLR